MNVETRRSRTSGIPRICLLAAQEITVAAAADLQSAMQDVAAQFEQSSWQDGEGDLRLIGKLLPATSEWSAIRHVLLGESRLSQEARGAGLIEPGTYYQYAKGKIVVWVQTNPKINVDSGLKALLGARRSEDRNRKSDACSVRTAAVSAMQKEEFYEKAKDKFVLGENISQTASFIVSGSADIGIVALSLALSPNMKSKGRYTEIPASEYPPIEQACVILNSSKNKQTAEQFLSYVKSDAVADLLVRFGFDVSGRSKN